MPPLLALILCTLFVLILLRLDRKQYLDASFALWVPTIWILLTSSKPLAIWFGYGGASMEEGSPLDRTLLIAILILGILILAKRRINWMNAIKENTYLVLLIGYMLVSILWSDIPFVSFKRWIKTFTTITMALVVATEVEPYQAIQCIFRRLMCVLLPFSLLLIKYYPHIGVGYGRWSGALMWNGAADTKNSLALLCLYAIFFIVWSFSKRWRLHEKPAVGYQVYIEIFILLLAIWLFLGPNHTLTHSATSTISLTVALILYFILSLMKKQNVTIGVGPLIIVMVSIIAYGTQLPLYEKMISADFASALGRDETLNTRTDIWAILVPYALQKPLLGYGLGGFWTDAMRDISDATAHNGYLDIVLNIGFVGHVLFCLFMLNCCLKARNLMVRDFNWGALWICCLLIALVHNIGESTTVELTGLPSALILFILGAYTFKYNKSKSVANSLVEYKASD